MPRKKKKSNNYYTKIQDVAICAYNKSDNPAQREKIYRRFIYPPFLKLTENLINIYEQRNIITETHNNEMRETIKYFMDEFVEYCYDNLNYIFTNPTDIHVADSVLHLFEERINIEDFNKKALYIFIRERTGLPTTNVTRVVKTLKHLYETKFREYADTEFMNLPF